MGWTGVENFQLHGFGDASPKGYGACIFLRAEMIDGSVVISLVIAKAKIAPLKKLTIPRLELLSCLLFLFVGLCNRCSSAPARLCVLLLD